MFEYVLVKCFRNWEHAKWNTLDTYTHTHTHTHIHVHKCAYCDRDGFDYRKSANQIYLKTRLHCTFLMILYLSIKRIQQRNGRINEYWNDLNTAKTIKLNGPSIFISIMCLKLR